MSNISFYLFETQQERQVDSACRLARKLLKQHPKLWWYCQDRDMQKILDDTLWSFDVCSFLGHGIEDPAAPICISAKLPTDVDWMIFNFNNHAVDSAAQFRHIIEIVENNNEAKQHGREKYRAYRALGITARTFHL